LCGDGIELKRDEIVSKSRGSSYITEDPGSGLKTLYIPLKHDPPKTTSIIDRQLRIPGALPLTHELMREIPKKQQQQQQQQQISLHNPSSSSSSTTSDDILLITQMTSLEKHEEEYGTSTVYSGAQRGRLSLPQEIDARLLGFDDDISFVTGATETIRNNATRLFF
jgi:hypothetical protein